MSNIEDLKTVFDSVVKGDDEAARQAFHTYATEKAAEILKSMKEEKSPIKLKGDDVYVEDKHVGSVKHDVEGDKGYEYTSKDGKKKKFESLKDMYAHIGVEHKLHEGVKNYEKEVQALPNRDKSKDEKAFEDGIDGKPDGKVKRKAKVEKLVSDIEKK